MAEQSGVCDSCGYIINNIRPRAYTENIFGWSSLGTLKGGWRSTDNGAWEFVEGGQAC